MDKQALLKQFSEREDKLEFSKALDALYACQKYKKNTYTHFINPIKTKRFISILNGEKFNDVSIVSFGGHAMAERSIIGFFYGEKCNQFPITAILINYSSKFSKKLSHRDFLGSIIGLGIDRSLIGDILVSNGEAIVYALDEISEYVCTNIEKVSNTRVTASKIEFEKIQESPVLKEEQRIIVASLRIDVILSSVFNMSRSQISKLISSEKVLLNWSVVTNASKPISEKDILTLRGFGRVEIFEIIGKTKKDRFIMNIYKFR